NLRVCFANRTDTQNCGQCEKCVRTAINLRIAGAGDLCTSFPRRNVAKTLSRIPINDDNLIFYLKTYLDELESSDQNDPELAKSIQKALNRSTLQEYAAEVWDTYRRVKLPFILLGQKFIHSLGDRIKP